MQGAGCRVFEHSASLKAHLSLNIKHKKLIFRELIFIFEENILNDLPVPDACNIKIS